MDLAFAQPEREGVKIFVHSSNPHRYHRLSAIVSPPSTKDHRRSTTPSSKSCSATSPLTTVPPPSSHTRIFKELKVCDLDLASKKTKRQGLVMIWTAVVWAIWTTT
ncbi:hypothetical protein QL285_079753 [Trifolium repens]|nr:hypothetical protein QL285_079753 [Trifolium repens]